MAEADPVIRTDAQTPIVAFPAFAVRLDAFLRVKPFISTEETRYYLNGVHVDVAAEGGAVCAATDGHRLGVRYDEEGIVLIPSIVRVTREMASWKPDTKLFRSPWLVGMSLGTGRGYVAIVEPGSDAEGNDTAEHAIARVEECSLRIGRAFIDGTYPNWRKVIPTNATSGPSRTFNADYVKAFTGKKNRIATIVGENKEATHLVQVEGEPEFIGVLMPVRGTAATLPDWIAAPKQSAAA